MIGKSFPTRDMQGFQIGAVGENTSHRSVTDVLNPDVFNPMSMFPNEPLDLASLPWARGHGVQNNRSPKEWMVNQYC
jgi:hypothetical protein